MKNKKYILTIVRVDYDGKVISMNTEYGIKEKLMSKHVSLLTDDKNAENNGIFKIKDYGGYVSLLWIDQSTRNFNSDHS